jgi:acetyl-CoA C-acetyltransferase
MDDIVIVSAVRTPIGRFGGTLKDTPAPKLGAIAIKEAVQRAKIKPEQVDEVLMGHVVPAGLGQNTARQASIHGGIPTSAGASTINKVCGSGLKAVMIGAAEIKAGDFDIIVAGGMENMNQCPFYLKQARYGYRLGDNNLVDGMVYDGLWDVYNNYHMGNTGEVIAEKFDIKRERIDEFALRSHKLAAKAASDGKFKDEMVPVEIPQRKGDPIMFETDEGVRADSSLESLARLKPVFKKDGVVTAGNASQISDGGAATVIMKQSKAEELGLTPLAKIAAYNTGGVEPELVMYAPIPTVKQLFEKTGFTINDIDLFEHNEAFASASVAVQQEIDVPEDKFNVHGGAVALGHPIGCSGARVLTTLLYAMHDRKAHRGLATLCLGGGNAVAMIVERFE